MDVIILYEDDGIEEFGHVTNIHYLDINNGIFIVIDYEKDKRTFIDYSKIIEITMK